MNSGFVPVPSWNQVPEQCPGVSIKVGPSHEATETIWKRREGLVWKPKY